MNNRVIFLKEALKIISARDCNNKPLPFSLCYRTFNSQTKKGGKLVRLAGVKNLPDKNENSNPSLSFDAVFSLDKSSKNPNHFINRTRNIELPSGDIKTIRIDFITEINGSKVIY